MTSLVVPDKNDEARVRFVGGLADGRPWIVDCPLCGGCIGSAAEESMAERMRDGHIESHASTREVRHVG